MTQSPSRWDVVILGGGPGGLATAIALRRISKLSVCIVEKESRTGRRIGEILPPAIIEPLSALGVWEQFLASGPVESAGVSVWWGSEARYDWDYIRVPYGRGWHVDRAVFDSMLEREATSLGATILRGWKAVGQEKDDAGFHIAAVHSHPAPAMALESAYVVDARGRSAAASAQSRHRIKIDRLVGLTRYYAHATASAQIEPRLWIESHSRGWWYSAPLPNRGFIATYMTDSDCSERPIARCFDLNLQLASMTRDRVGALPSETCVLATSAHSGRRRHFSGGTLIAVGDAAYSTDPAHGHGLLNAMRHGLAAAKSIVDVHGGGSPGFTAYDEQLSDEWAKYLAGRSLHYQTEMRWPNEPFWARRQTPRQQRIAAGHC